MPGHGGNLHGHIGMNVLTTLTNAQLRTPADEPISHWRNGAGLRGGPSSSVANCDSEDRWAECFVAGSAPIAGRSRRIDCRYAAPAVVVKRGASGHGADARAPARRHERALASPPPCWYTRSILWLLFGSKQTPLTRAVTDHRTSAPAAPSI